MQQASDLTRVWLHGAGLSAGTWGGRADGLCLNLPGHGGRPRVAPATVERFAEALAPELPARAVVIGHSLGGMVAMALAAGHPDRVAGLVVAESAYTMQARWIDRKGAGLAVWMTRKLGPWGVARLAAAGQTGATRRMLMRETAAMLPEALTDAMAAAHGFDGRTLLAALTMPVLIVVGRRNPRTHPQARSLQRALPDARLAVLDAGHMLHADAPDAFHAAVDRFVRQVGQGAATTSSMI